METFYTYDNRRRLSNLAVNSGNTTKYLMRF